MLLTRPARAVLSAAAAIAVLAVGLPAANSADAPEAPRAPAGAAEVTTQNPISAPFSDTYADPAILRGKDGWWYMYATSDPLHEGDSPFGIMHIARTKDFADWEYVGNVFEQGDTPAWATSTSLFWAPDVRYVDGRYVLYYTVTDTIADPGAWNYAIGAATAPTPAGPWTDSGGAVIGPRKNAAGNTLWTIDPALLADDDGSRYLYFGSYVGGLWVTALDETGTRAVGEPVQVAHDERYEGSFVVKRDGYYYLTASSANCCAGPVTGYSVYAGRSTSPLGPFVDHEGVSLMDARVGGTQVVAQNGNRWIGVGHHALFTDVSGQDHILYHAIDRNDPWLNAPGGVNRRPTLIDRLDWIDGWPVARAGSGPSDTPQPAPMTTSELGIDSADPASNTALRASASEWETRFDDVGGAGAYAGLVPSGPETAATAVTAQRAPKDVRVEADVRLPTATASFAIAIGAVARHGVTVTLDPAEGLTVEARSGDQTVTGSAPLPARYDPSIWTSLAVEVNSGRLTARLSESRLGDADAEVSLDLPDGAQKPMPVRLTATRGEAHVDNLTVVAAHSPVTDRVDEPRAGAEFAAEEFDTDLGEEWQWTRPDERVTVTDGTLTWPLASADIVGRANTGPLLLRDSPDGDWIAETKLHLDLGTDTVRNYQQAGMVVHVDDDHFLRLGSVAIWGTRQVEFGKEIDEAGTLRWGAHLGGPTATDLWLRLAHTTDPETGEHRYRSASSRDGQTWRWGATWTLPADTTPRIGLYAGGGATPATTAAFDYFRVHEAE